MGAHGKQSPKRQRRRIRRMNILGPERQVISRDSVQEMLECGHSIPTQPTHEPQKGELFRRCATCRDEVE